jgi:hypothetical protein
MGFGPKQIKKKADGYAEEFYPEYMFFKIV